MLENNDLISKVMRFYGEWGENSLSLIKEFISVGDTVVDVGANIGTFSVAMAKMVGSQGKVLAYEAQRRVFYNLCSNLLVNGCFNVNAKQCLVGSSPGEARLNMSDHAAPPDRIINRGGMRFVDALERPHNTYDSQDLINITNLDRELMALQSCSLIKIDVEGAEALVVQGGAKAIAKHRPILYLECGSQKLLEQLQPLLETLYYQCFWHASLHYNSNNYFRCNNLTGTCGDMNVLCIPAEHNFHIEPLTERHNIQNLTNWEGISKLFPNFIF